MENEGKSSVIFLKYHQVNRRIFRAPTAMRQAYNSKNGSSHNVGAHYPPSSNRVPNGNSREMTFTKKETVHPALQDWHPRTSIYLDRHTIT